jgi:hypothetical protein
VLLPLHLEIFRSAITSEVDDFNFISTLAMLQMKKINLAAMKKAYLGE